MNQIISFLMCPAHQQSIQYVCFSEDCKEKKPCCSICHTKFHNQHELLQLPEVMKEAKTLVEKYQQLMDLNEFLKNECLKLIKNISDAIETRFDIQYEEMPNISQLDEMARLMQIKRYNQKNDRIEYSFNKEKEIIYQSFQRIYQCIFDEFEYSEYASKPSSSQSSRHKEQPQKLKESILNKECYYKLIDTLKVQTNKIECLATSSNYYQMATGDQEGKIILWDIKQKNIIDQYQSPNQSIYSLYFTSRNQYLFAGQDTTILQFKLDGKKFIPTKIYEQHKGSVSSIVITKNCQYMFSGSRDKSLKIWDVQSALVKSDFRLNEEVSKIALSSDQKYLSCCCDGQSYIFKASSITEFKLLNQWEVSKFNFCTEFTPDSAFLLITDMNGVTVWEVDQIIKPCKLQPYKVFRQASYHSKLSIDGSILFSVGSFHNIYVINFETKQTLQTLQIAESAITQYIVLSHNMKYMITNADSQLYIYELIMQP